VRLVIVLAACTTVAAAACKTSSPRASAHDIFAGKYRFETALAGQHVSGTLSFQQGVTYAISSTHGDCGRRNFVPAPRVRFTCRDLQIHATTEAGQLRERIEIAVRTEELVERTGSCRQYYTDPTTRQRTCVVWDRTMEKRSVWHNGSTRIHRLP
jgi:hypothetical protein